MSKVRWSARAIVLLIAASMLLSGALCRRTVTRDGVRMPADEAQRLDLEEAQGAMSDGRFDDAISRYRGFQKQYPDSRYNSLVLARMGEAYYKKGEYDAARASFKEVLDRYPRGGEVADAAWGLALIAKSEKRCSEIEYLVGAYREMAEDKRWDQMTMLLAECKKEAGDPAAALRIYGEEYQRGKDPDMRSNSKGLAEQAVRDADDAALEQIGQDFQAGFPGDLAMLELIRRDIENDSLEQGKVRADLFAERYPGSAYFPEFQDLRDLLEKRIKVRANRIGVMLPLSGEFSSVGEQALKGMILAGKVFDQVGAMFQADLVIRDTAADKSPEQIVDELVNESHVIAIVGPLRNSIAERAAAKAQELAIPLVALSPGEDLPLIGDMIYQNCLTKSAQAEALADYAVNDKKITAFAVFFPDDDYGRDYLRLFAKAVADRGGAVAASQPYNKEDTDFRDDIRALKSRRSGDSFKIIFIPDSWRRVAMIAPQLRYYRLTGVNLLGVNGWHSTELLRRTQPEDLEGAVFTDGMAPEAERPAFNSFTRAFKNEFGGDPGIMEAQAYESVDLLLNVINKYRVRDRQQLKTALDHVSDFPGVLGPISIDSNGRWKKQIYLFMITERNFMLISE